MHSNNAAAQKTKVTTTTTVTTTMQDVIATTKAPDTLKRRALAALQTIIGHVLSSLETYKCHIQRVIEPALEHTWVKILMGVITASGLTLIFSSLITAVACTFLSLPTLTWLPWGWILMISEGFSLAVVMSVVVNAAMIAALLLCMKGGVSRAIGQWMVIALIAWMVVIVLAGLISAFWQAAPFFFWRFIALLESVSPDTTSIADVSLFISVSLVALITAALYFTPLKRAKKTLGNAHFASAWEIQKSGLFAEEGIVLGIAHGKMLKLPSFESVLVTAPTGSGKTTAIAIPNLLDWQGSIIANDLKGELYERTADYRKNTLNQPVYCFAPSNPTQHTHGYNPFYYVSRNPNLIIRDLQLIAETLIPAERVDGGFWYTSARDLFMLLALYLIETEGEATLAGIHDLAKQSDFFIWLSFQVQQQTMKTPVFYQNANSLLNADAEKTQKNILKDFHSRMTLFSDPLIRNATRNNDFDVRKLRQEKMSIYLNIPDSDKERLKPILTLFWAQCIHLLTQETPDIQQEPYPILAILDEFGNMARINKLKEGMSFLRSYRFCAIVIVQYLSQIISTYGQHDAKGFLNAKVKIAFALSDLDDAKFFSESLGKTTVKAHSTSSSSGQHESSSKSISFQTRPLLTPDELMQLKKDDAIIILEAANPIKAKKGYWFKTHAYRKRLSGKQ